MRTVFQLLFLITFVLFSPFVFIILSVHMAAPSGEILKSQLAKKDVYNSAVSELQKQIDTAVSDASSDDPLLIVGPFIKKEISVSYVRGKVETLIDDTQAWINGKGVEPVLSFKDLKDKLMKQNRNMVAQLEQAVKDMEKQQASMGDQPSFDSESGGSEKMPFTSKDLDKFLKSDFTIPMGVYIGWTKVLATSIYILGIVLAVCYGLSLLLIFLLAPTLQSKLRWVGWTLLLTALWNIPGVLLSAGSAVVIAKTFTTSMTGAQYITPFVETFLSSIVTSYAKVTSGTLVTLFIFSIGILVISLFANPAEASVQAVKAPVKKKK